MRLRRPRPRGEDQLELVGRDVDLADRLLLLRLLRLSTRLKLLLLLLRYKLLLLLLLREELLLLRLELSRPLLLDGPVDVEGDGALLASLSDLVAHQVHSLLRVLDERELLATEL